MRSTLFRALTLLAAAAIVLVGGGLAAGSGMQPRTAVVPPAPSNPGLAADEPSSSPVRSFEPPSVAPAASPTATPSGDLGAGFTWTGSPEGGNGNPLGETATLLHDGRVLVTEPCGTTAELYDPRTGTFTATGSLTVTRGGGTATLLADGRVLVAGGYNCGAAGQDGIWASAEIYDPASGTFEPTGTMGAAREFHTATLLNDGRVLVAGGVSGPPVLAAGGIVLASVTTADSSSSVLSTAEIFDPLSGTFRKTGSMGTFRDHHTATLLADGRVLVAGGGGEGYASSTSAEVYDPTTDRFEATGSMREGRWLHTASLLGDGRVLVLGGRSPRDSVYRSAEMYDPRSGKFATAGSMRDGRQQHTATVLPDGRVFIAGGVWQDGIDAHVLSATEMYDPSAGTFTRLGSMGTPRSEHTATLLPDGRVLIVGGIDIGAAGGLPVTSAVLFEP